MRLIDAAELLQTLAVTVDNFDPRWLRDRSIRDGLKIAKKAIEESQTVDAAPVVHGQWIGTADGYADGELVYDMWRCSECDYDADGADEKPGWRFCPNCGAKMELEG